MTAIKELKRMKSYAKIVFVNRGEEKSLPSNVVAALNKAGRISPTLVFLSPNGDTTYGSFSYTNMKAQNYKKIFKDVKKKIKTAKKNGELKSSGPSKIKDPKAEVKEADTDKVVISAPSFRIWKSKKGKSIKAKLMKFEKERYYFKTSKGKMIKIKATYLDPTSVEQANEIIELNKK